MGPCSDLTELFLCFKREIPNDLMLFYTLWKCKPRFAIQSIANLFPPYDPACSWRSAVDFFLHNIFPLEERLMGKWKRNFLIANSAFGTPCLEDTFTLSPSDAFWKHFCQVIYGSLAWFYSALFDFRHIFSFILILCILMLGFLYVYFIISTSCLGPERWEMWFY